MKELLLKIIAQFLEDLQVYLLRAEPLSNEPILLNKTLDFLLDLARNSKDTDDAKIHALNILRFIF